MAYAFGIELSERHDFGGKIDTKYDRITRLSKIEFDGVGGMMTGRRSEKRKESSSGNVAASLNFRVPATLISVVEIPT